MRSMTGYGKAVQQRGNQTVEVEIRSVNNRFLKFAAKLSPCLFPFENEIRKLVMQHLSRGVVDIYVTYKLDKVERRGSVQEAILESYYRQIASLAQKRRLPRPHLEDFLTLPGVIVLEEHIPFSEEEWTWVQETILLGIHQLMAMREAEGLQLAQDLEKCRLDIAQALAEIERLAPQIVANSTNRLCTRLQDLLLSQELPLFKEEVLKEMVICTERLDINEEVVRLKSHLTQFHTISQATTEIGRSLEFLSQEILREANTIGAKINDTACAMLVIQIKTTVEKIRELVQNVE